MASAPRHATARTDGGGTVGTVVVICSLPGELRALPRLERTRNVGPEDVLTGTLHGRRVAVVTTGIGRARAEQRVQNVLDSLSPPVTWALSIGYGGGLGDAVRSGDILLADSVVSQESPEEEYVPDPGIFRRACELHPGAFRLVPGRLLTAPSIAADPETKTQLRASTQAEVVDMETSGVASALVQAEIPALYARCVVDEASLTVPRDIGDLVSPQGRLQTGRTLRWVLSHPGRVPSLWQLATRSRRAATNIAWFVRALLLSSDLAPHGPSAQR